MAVGGRRQGVRALILLVTSTSTGTGSWYRYERTSSYQGGCNRFSTVPWPPARVPRRKRTGGWGVQGGGASGEPPPKAPQAIFFGSHFFPSTSVVINSSVRRKNIDFKSQIKSVILAAQIKHIELVPFTIHP